MKLRGHEHPTASFSVEQAPANSLQGTILSWSGQILWQSRIATQASLLTSTIPLHQGESIETKENGMISFAFSPIASVSAEPKTSLELIQTVPTSMVVEQLFGTASYIVSDGQKLSVRALHTLLEQSGGKMSVSVVPDTQIVMIKLYSGQATVAFNDINTVSTVVSLKAGETFVFHDDTRLGRVTK